ncbi:MAG: nucleotidyltransferase domain-containing protein, partial [archaeon]
MKKEVIISKGIKSILKKNVIGIYLHGSVATEGHRSWTSDIDLFILLKDHLSKEDKEALIKYLNKFRNPMVEASFVLEKDVKSLG